MRCGDENYPDDDGEATGDGDVASPEEIGYVANEGADCGDGQGVADGEPGHLTARTDGGFDEGERAAGEVEGDL